MLIAVNSSPTSQDYTVSYRFWQTTILHSFEMERVLPFSNPLVTLQKAILWYYNGVTQSPPAKGVALNGSTTPFVFIARHGWVNRSIRGRRPG